ncbi:expressed unknown protein [Seminavis robusta]|uniref:Uncharacterized protein n=1 Tax=Seminavis robusta TaxID=568900 RepID=A0A9N8HCP9_9STRA|nr:expressed unknown protein [Seminavis robusta]|eukprot:Sro326_g118210.1 n/a (129) ;mRNA; f:57170-57556
MLDDAGDCPDPGGLVLAALPAYPESQPFRSPQKSLQRLLVGFFVRGIINMAGKQATEQVQGKVVCENCDKSTQKDLPDNTIASSGNACGDFYQSVSACMTENKGQVSACAKEWDAFRKCHDDDKLRKQ